MRRLRQAPPPPRRFRRPLERRVLVLNRLWQAVNVVPVRRAMGLVYTGRARAVGEDLQTFDWEAWLEASRQGGGCAGNGGGNDDGTGAATSSAEGEAAFLGTVSGPVKVPEIVQHLYFDRVPRPSIKLTRANVYLRDDYRCQYCGADGSPGTLNIDHIVPRSRGGRTTWDNVVVACVSCNLRKGDQLPEEVGMQVRRPARRPRWHPSVILGQLGDPPERWRPFLEFV